ncbi:MAG: hypothetical protein A3E01_08295 [Gammaproteobacteria bacterium RIFCSPHIGHO2_12_FULL_63_22]|nr:MAG: hypothetical protein A3E01_08295 [Gammaproteobacteria bacterium RIFCSPHIGHO2_12_FULL_63_22]
MATFNKFNDFVEQMGLKQHDLNADPLYVFLTNELPLATDTTRANIADLSTGGGYTAGGADTQNTASESPAGTMTVVGTDIVFTATTGFGPFQYAVLYNQVGGLGAGNKLIGWWDYASAVTLLAGETFTVDFGTSILTVT